MADETDSYGFTIKDAQRIDRSVAWFEHNIVGETSGRRPPATQQYVWYWGKLKTACTAGTFAVPTTCTVDVWEPDPSSVSATPPLVITTEAGLLAVTVINYDVSLSGPIGTICKIEYLEPNWSFKWIGC